MVITRRNKSMVRYSSPIIIISIIRKREGREREREGEEREREGEEREKGVKS